MEIFVSDTKDEIIIPFDIISIENLVNDKMETRSKKRVNSNQNPTIEQPRKRNKKNAKKALLIGINYRGQDGELRGCVNDVKGWKEILIKEYDFEEEDIVLMTDERDTMKELIPTRSNIMEKIKWLIQSKSGDSLVFAYSGHGGSVRDKNRDETDGKDETLIPLDYEEEGEIVDDDIRKIFVDQIPSNVKLTCIIDACHSQSILDLRYTLVPISKDDFYFKVDPMKKNTVGDVICISGCRDDQTSADTIENGKNVGALTFCLHEILKETNYDISYLKLLQKAKEWLKKMGYTQIPQMSFGKLKYVESDFNFCK